MLLRRLAAALVLVAAGGGAAGCTVDELDESAAAEAIAEREQQVSAAAAELVGALRTDLGVDSRAAGARVRLVGCGSPVLHGVRVRAEQAPAGTDQAPEAFATDLGTTLTELGWEVDLARPDLVTATRDELTLRVQPGPAAVPWSITSDCADTSADVAEDLLERGVPSTDADAG